jgi:hypothetical protein
MYAKWRSSYFVSQNSKVGVRTLSKDRNAHQIDRSVPDGGTLYKLVKEVGIKTVLIRLH